MSTGIRTERTADDLALVTFDQPGAAANVLSREVLQALDGALDWVAAQPGLRGVVFLSAKPTIFIAGADVKQLAALDHDDALRAMIREGQRVFARVGDLAVPSVAAIHGACLGGGCELALACDYRVASDDHRTRIGLPETSLGIVPAWGGCTRLPRLVGFPKACDLILGAKRLAPKPALRAGLVDAVVPREALLTMARRLVAKGRPVRKRHGVVNQALIAGGIARVVSRDLEHRTRGHYPAVYRALDAMRRGLRVSVAESQRLEEEAVVQLAVTPTCHNLMRVFFQQERAKHLRLDNAHPPPRLERVAVIGAGVMGAGIAQWLSAHERAVILKDVDVDRVRQGMATIATLYREAVRHHVLEAVAARAGLDRLAPTAVEVPLAGTELVIEAAVENMTIKQEIFRRLGEATPAETILATNTSALSVTELARVVRHPERVIGVHFFNPVHRMQLVEVIVGAQTAPAVVDRVLRFVQEVGKLPVVVQDRPGFVVNRILMPYLIEAGHLFEAGAPVARIDEAMLDFGMPMGPLRLIDEVGVDVASHVAGHLSACFGARMAVPAVLSAMVAAGQLGRKRGSGFYRHAGGNRARPHAALAKHVRNREAAGLDEDALVDRMALLMVNEGARCLDEGVVGEAQDVDFAMIMGTGFSPFRGGPLRYADGRGIVNVVRELDRLAARVHARFEPCERLRRMAEREETFYHDMTGGDHRLQGGGSRPEGGGA
ncbi:MAG: enoyl-CoA hydratase/isomerase family protein [Lentisphaerae bacterium]|nr:enoyl-CoA hydratase/isomerase family protein [Lentisphaerota bacterium]